MCVLNVLVKDGQSEAADTESGSGATSHLNPRTSVSLSCTQILSSKMRCLP